jgi:hypothetical protein
MENNRQPLYQLTQHEEVVTKDKTQLVVKCHALMFINRGTTPVTIGSSIKLLPMESYSVPDCFPPFVFTAQYNIKFHENEDQYPLGGTAVMPVHLVQGNRCIITQIPQKSI